MKIFTQKPVLLSFVIVIAFLSCKKNKVESFCTPAAVQYAPGSAGPGLNWRLITDSVYSLSFEFPENLPDEFKVDVKLVDVCYSFTNKDAGCSCGTPPKTMVSIISIKPH
jgi:hypothetical protein